MRTKAMTPGGLRRRDFLRRLAAASVGAPLVNAYCREALAEPGTEPVRLLCAANLNGRGAEGWQTAGGETDFRLSTIHQPLEPFRKKILILEEVNNEAGRRSSGNTHRVGTGSVMTGFPTQGGDGAAQHGGPSVDQVIAAKIGSQTPFASLQFGVPPTTSGIRGAISARAAGQPLTAQVDPLADRIRAERRSVLDLLRAQLDGLKRATGTDFHRHVDAHLESIRSVERRLQETPAMTSTCSRPGRPDGGDHPRVSRQQMDLIAASFACNLTRVATLMYSTATNTVVYSWLGQTGEAHAMSHAGDSDTATWKKITDIERWHMGELAYLLGKLEAFPSRTGAGTLLDQCAIFWSSDHGKGNSHSFRPIPAVIAGGAGGQFRTGRFLKLAGVPHNRILTSLAHAMGVPVDTVGLKEIGTGGLAQLHG